MHGINTFNRSSPASPPKIGAKGKIAILPVLLAGLFLCAPVAHAEDLQIKPVIDNDPEKIKKEAEKSMINNPYTNYLSFSYENDRIGSGEDSFYTSGVRMSYFNTNTDLPDFMKDAADEIPGFDINDTTGTYFTLGQNLYSPSRIDSAEPIEGDRPYAGWLYGSVGLTTLTANHVDDVELTLGIVGPEALGEQTQKFIHTHVTDSPTPRGWANQLDTEPGVVLSWQRRWPGGFNGQWEVDFGDEWRLRAEPSVNVSVGNVYTYGGTGLMFTFGPYQGTLQDAPPRVKPAMSGTGYFDVPDQDWSWYTFAGVDGRAVARNIFLDGNSFDSDGPDVDKKYLVGDAVAGVAFTLNNYRLSYTANYRTKEFDGQPDDTFFGSLTLTSRF